MAILRFSAFPSTVFSSELAALSFHLAPELFVGDAARLFDLAARLIEQRLKLRRMRQHQPFQFVVIGDRQQHGDRLAIPGHDHRPLLALFQVGAQTRLDVRDGSDLHPSNSFPPKKRRSATARSRCPPVAEP
jgi:hypothetical protein